MVKSSPTTDNLPQFLDALDEADEELTERDLVILHSLIVKEYLTTLVHATPHDEGEARGGYIVSIGRPSAAKGILDPSGATVISNGLAKLVGLAPLSIVWISNNVRHIDILDLGGFVPPDPGPSRDHRSSRAGKILVRGGFSVQAPNGMSIVADARIESLFN